VQGLRRVSRRGFTGGGNGTHQVYIGGLTDHRLKNADIVDHLVELIEKKGLEAAQAAAASHNRRARLFSLRRAALATRMTIPPRAAMPHSRRLTEDG